MKLVFIGFAISIAAELVLYMGKHMWRLRTVLAMFVTVLAAFASGALVIWHLNSATILILLGSLYRAFNATRVAKGRMHERYLQRATRRTSYTLIGIQVGVAGLWWAWHTIGLERRWLWLGFAIVQVLVAAMLLASTIRRLRRTMPHLANKHYSDSDLPSISIAIPARNETEDLEQCLISIIANDYPKFEVLVLDDCSQDKRTPEIIRSFAHEGVRFVAGEEPRDTWLAKNQAYDKLVREASGEYILFCGVDVRFEPDSIRKLVTEMLARNKQMMSILPERREDVVGRFSLVQAMRYWWELVPPRRFFNRPAVLSSCWIIKRQALQRAGGFPAVARAIVPEAYFARQLIKPDAYSFLLSSTVLGVASVKSVADQRDTALRTRYPQLHRRPELVFVTSVLEAGFLVLPFVTALAGWWLPAAIPTAACALVASVLLSASYEKMALATKINHWLFGLVALPIVVVTDIAQLHRSMWLYEFAEVEWKGRNVCVPVMHTIPHLPPLE